MKQLPISIRKFASIAIVIMVMAATHVAQGVSAWRVNSPSFADFANQVTAAVRNATPGMPYYGYGQPQSPAFVPLDFRYVVNDIPAVPVRTNPMSKTSLWASWKFDLNDDNIWLYVIPAGSIESEFIRTNAIRNCPADQIDSGQPSFGGASCNSSGASGANSSSNTGGAFYSGYATVAVLRACGLVRVSTQISTHSPREAGTEARQDGINESRATASRIAKEIMTNLLQAFDPVCSNVGRQPPATPSPYPTPVVTPTPVMYPTPIVTPSPSPTPIGDPGIGMRKLLLYYNSQHHDSLTIASDEAIRGAAAGGYQYLGEVGGYVFAGAAPGTVPLSLWYNPTYADYFTSTTNDTVGMARLNYRFVRVEGYIYPTQQPNSTPLKTFWGASRADYFGTATSAGETSALQNGYQYVRVEGFLPIASTMIPGSCGLGVRWDETEDGWNGVWTRRGDSGVFDSIWTSPTGQRAGALMTIGIAGTEVTIRRDQSGLGTCTYKGQIGADGVSVSGGYTCSWWPNGGTNVWRAIIRCN